MVLYRLIGQMNPSGCTLYGRKQFRPAVSGSVRILVGPTSRTASPLLQSAAKSAVTAIAARIMGVTKDYGRTATLASPSLPP
jgi:hypothetical protein